MPFDEFVNWALYDSEIGYYQKPTTRVGKNTQADFYTSTSLFKPVWAKLLIDSCCKLLGKHNPKDFIFIEIAAEPERNSLAQENHPFKEMKTICLGDDLDIPEKAIVFSNEWLDAQPFKRFRFDTESKQWQEIGVKLVGKIWTEENLPINENATVITKNFPKDYKIPYTIDWTTGAEKILNSLVQLNWHGLFLTFDYGLNSQRILRDFPEGTARSYQNHRMCADILNNPGMQDITCHICWDSLQEILINNQFININLQNQESFFMNHGQRAIKSIIENPESNEEFLGSLKELIHPQHLGHKFQALYGHRGI